jgi:DNA replication protein DnaC
LVLDEWGYIIPVDREGSQLLFRVIDDCYEKKSLIVTTNLPFDQWGTIFTNEQLTATMLDRLVHHGHLIQTGPESQRMRHALIRDRLPPSR